MLAEKQSTTFKQRWRGTKYISHTILLWLLALVCVGCSTHGVLNGKDDGSNQPGTTPTTSTQTKTPVTSKTPTPQSGLPGQQIWKDGASSYLFGTNDTEEWSEHNIETEPAIQQALHDAGFTLMRTFFKDNAPDDAIETRIKTAENSGTRCLGVITNIRNETYNKHLLQYLGDRCLMYEFGNEYDYAGMSVTEYLSLWNSQVPKLRQVNPKAIFIGPVTYNKTGRNDFLRHFLEGVASSKVLPDAVSFHWYPCWEDTRQGCLDKAESYADVAQEVRGLVWDTLKKDIPIGITEWNYDPANPPPSYGDDADFVTQFTTNALHAMIRGKVAFACQFDAASYSGYGRHDMFDLTNNQPKPQFYAVKAVIAAYKPQS